ncbi:MAG: F0F1 ATP synthase subunit B' [Campylobacteraceae bacterium]|nr:F0F1 ATP synthase subunit B' [Campylobacteraceae bacterium]
MIDVSVPALILTIIVFIVLVGYLNRLLYQPLLSFMDARDAAIKRDEDLANQNFAAAGSEAEEIEAILKEAREKAGKIREEGLKAIEEDASSKLSAKTASLEADFNSFLEDLSKEKEELKAELKEGVPAFRDSIKEKLARI